MAAPSVCRRASISLNADTWDGVVADCPSEHSARHYAEITRQRPMSEEPITPPPSTRVLEDLLTALYQAHAHFREVIAELAENDVNQPCARGMNVAEFIRMAVRHSTWRASQIATVRRMYRYHCC